MEGRKVLRREKLGMRMKRNEYVGATWTSNEPGIEGEHSYDEMRALYSSTIDKTEYPDFEGWLWDMERTAVFFRTPNQKEEDRTERRNEGGNMKPVETRTCECCGAEIGTYRFTVTLEYYQEVDVDAPNEETAVRKLQDELDGWYVKTPAGWFGGELRAYDALGSEVAES